MDLVEIRKKAKGKKKKTAKSKKQSSEEVVEQQEQVETAEIEEEHPGEVAAASSEVDSDKVIEPGVAEPEVSVEPVAELPEEKEHEETTSGEADPLDALFSFQQETGMEIVDNYLQALAVEDEIADSNIEQWLTFSLGDEEYALSIESVSEIIKPREVTDIPRVPDFISGIISLRGIIVPVFDLNRRLNLGQAELGASSRIIVCQNEDRLAGFIVDSINQVVNVPIGNIEPPPTVLSGLDRDFVEGVGRVDGRMLILLHLSNVINAELV
jgi:purine-binding chemotaxis protein CheW